MALALKDRLERLQVELAPRAEALALTLSGPALPTALELPPRAAAWAESALGALAEAACIRAGAARCGGALALGLGVVGGQGGGRLRAFVIDALPGLTESAQTAAFAYLAGEAPPPEPDPLGVAALREAGGLAELDFASGAAGNLIWAERAQVGAAATALPGWTRRPRLDAGDLRRRLGGDERIAQLVVATFRGDAPQQLAALAAALATRPGEALRLAHSLKGAARNVGGLMLGEVAAALEAELRDGRPAWAGACLPRLRWELARLDAALAAGPI